MSLAERRSRLVLQIWNTTPTTGCDRPTVCWSRARSCQATADWRQAGPWASWRIAGGAVSVSLSND